MMTKALPSSVTFRSMLRCFVTRNVKLPFQAVQKSYVPLKAPRSFFFFNAELFAPHIFLRELRGAFSST